MGGDGQSQERADKRRLRPTSGRDAPEREAYRGVGPVASGDPVAGRSGQQLNVPEPYGVSEDSPMHEGSEPTAVSRGEWAERRASKPDRTEGDGVGTMEPTEAPEAGPKAAPDPAPPRRPFPDSGPADIS